MDQETNSLVSIASEAINSNIFRSDLGNHCRTITAKEPARDKKDQLIYYCRYCSWAKSGSTNFRYHLNKKHQIKHSPSSRTNTEASNEQEANTADQERQILVRVLNKQDVQQRLVDLIVVRCLPLSLVEWKEFHLFCRTLNPQCTTIPRSHNTIQAWIQNSFQLKKDIVRKTLQSAKTRIHLSVDVWTSPNTYLVLAICGQFINIENQLQTVLLGLRTIDGHGGEIQFDQALRPVLIEYGIQQKIGILMGDNSGTNDVLCRTLSEYLHIEYPRDPEWVITQQRIRCLGHILNLIVQQFLFPKEETEINKILASYETEEEQEGEDTEKKKKERGQKIRTYLGSLGKLHNIVVHIRSSPGRTAEFVENAKRRIPLDNRTRWNSWYQMLSAVFSDEKVEPSLRTYTSKYEDKLSADELSNSDWKHLRTIYTILGVFSAATKTAEGNYATIEKVYENLDVCYTFLVDQSKVSYLRTILIYLLRKIVKADFEIS
jgi:hypothetical protein